MVRKEGIRILRVNTITIPWFGACSLILKPRRARSTRECAQSNRKIRLSHVVYNSQSFIFRQLLNVLIRCACSVLFGPSPFAYALKHFFASHGPFISWIFVMREIGHVVHVCGEWKHRPAGASAKSVQDILSSLVDSAVSIGSASGQRKPWSDWTDVYIWVETSENVPSNTCMCAQRRFRSVCAFALSNENLHWAHFR